MAKTNATQENQTVYEKLSKSEQMVVDVVLENLEHGAGLWQQGWVSSGAPQNAVTGKPYKGRNNMILHVASMKYGYNDNRWMTFNQMSDKGWSFKRDEEGNSLGKNRGIGIIYYDLKDRATKRPFDRSVLDGMSDEERERYMEENVYALRRIYTVFNADLIDGIPEKEHQTAAVTDTNKRADTFLQDWSDNEARIIYGGSSSYYSPRLDEIHLPPREVFYSNAEFYSTAFHELGHSTGHESRLNRAITTSFGSEEYAAEELRAEIGSMFLEQEFGIPTDPEHMRNNSAYIEHWHSMIKSDPNVLFNAIAEASNIANFAMKKEAEFAAKKIPQEKNITALAGPFSSVDSALQESDAASQKPGHEAETKRGDARGDTPLAAREDNLENAPHKGVQGGVIPLAPKAKKEIEPYAIVKDLDDNGETVYKVLMTREHGQTGYALSGYPFRSQEALMLEFGRMQQLPFWREKEFQEVSIDELEAMSIKRADDQYADEQQPQREQLYASPKTENSAYMKPSEYAEKAENDWRPDMSNRGMDSLPLSDRDVVTKAEQGEDGEIFRSLYDGERVTGEWEADANSIMRRMALHTSDKEQLLRAFRSSGQFREDFPAEEFDKMAAAAMTSVKEIVPKTSTSEHLKKDPARQNHYSK